MHSTGQVFTASSDACIAVQPQITAWIEVLIALDQKGFGSIEAANISELCRDELLHITEHIVPPDSLCQLNTAIKDIGNLAVGHRRWRVPSIAVIRVGWIGEPPLNNIVKSIC